MFRYKFIVFYPFFVFHIKDLLIHLIKIQLNTTIKSIYCEKNLFKKNFAMGHAIGKLLAVQYSTYDWSKSETAKFCNYNRAINPLRPLISLLNFLIYYLSDYVFIERFYQNRFNKPISNSLKCFSADFWRPSNFAPKIVKTTYQ